MPNPKLDQKMGQSDWLILVNDTLITAVVRQEAFFDWAGM